MSRERQNFDLWDLGLFERRSEHVFETLTDVVVSSFDVATALITIIDYTLERQFFSAFRGLPEPFASVGETTIDLSVCRTVVETSEVLAISDMIAHPDFSDHLSVKKLGAHAYLGCPFYGPANDPIGAICAISHTPRNWRQDEIRLMHGLSNIVTKEILLRASLKTITYLSRCESTDRSNFH